MKRNRESSPWDILDRPEDATDESEIPPGWLHWPIWLWFRPARFFDRFAATTPDGVFFICVWLVAVADVIDRIDRRALTGRSNPLPDMWNAHWTVTLIAATIGAFILYAIGGWWYGVRVRWSRPAHFDTGLARRVYFFSGMIIAVPGVTAELYETIKYPTPSAADQAASLWYAALLIFPFWALLTSYVGVRTVFQTSRVRTMGWFVLAPATLYGIGLAAIAFLVFGPTLKTPPDLANPLTYTSDHLQFSYPGNWWIDQSESGFDPDCYLTVEPLQDAMIWIERYASEQSVREEANATRDALVSQFAASASTPNADTSQWGDFDGVGFRSGFQVDGAQYSTEVFVTELSDGSYLEIQATWPVADASIVVPGFDMIERTFRFMP